MGILHGHLDKLEQEGHGKVQTAKKQEYRESRMTDDQFHKQKVCKQLLVRDAFSREIAVRITNHDILFSFMIIKPD